MRDCAVKFHNEFIQFVKFTPNWIWTSCQKLSLYFYKDEFSQTIGILMCLNKLGLDFFQLLSLYKDDLFCPVSQLLIKNLLNIKFYFKFGNFSQLLYTIFY